MLRWRRGVIPGALLLATGAAAVAAGNGPESRSVARADANSPDRGSRSTQTSLARRIQRPVVLAFAGDIHFESPIREQLARDPRRVLAAIGPVLRRADVAVANLETAVTTRGTPQPKQYAFRAPPSAFAALEAGGIDVASMANNHGMDYGEVGLRDSIAAARKARFPVIGIGRTGREAYAPYRVTIRGRRIAIIGATQVLDDHLIAAWTAGPHKPGLASAKNVARLLQAVRQARRNADTVVVYLHWGVELASCATTDQRRLARRLVSAGADIVAGGHAHRLLGTGRMGRALVSYGLGNFVWYSSGDVTTETGVLLVTVAGRRVSRYRFVPARITNGSPRPLGGTERTRAIAAWRSLRSCSGLRS